MSSEANQAKLKYKCQCGKPYSVELTKNCRIVNLTNILHFKAADRYCERCGAALCEDCESQERWLKAFPGFTVKKVHLCRTCAELEE